jgi:P27 family predicted phage terminase small subunit
VNARGRPPKPTALKLISGNPGKRALPKDEPRPPVELPAMPAWLTPEARVEWQRLGPVLVRLRLLTRLDRAAFAAYCQAWSRFVQAEQELSKTSPMAFTANGYPIVNPWQTISNQAVGLMSKFLGEFGLTPAARTRINAPHPLGGSGDGDGDAVPTGEATFAF